MKRSLLLAALGVSALLTSVGCNRGEPMVAVVNGESIPMEKFHKYLEVKPTVQVLVNPAGLQAGTNGQLPQQPYTGQVIGSLGLQAMTDLIQQTVLKQLAKDEKVYPTPDEIEAEINDRKKDNPNFITDLIKAGFTMSMINDEIASELAQFKLTTEGVTVTDEEVRGYMKDHPQEFIQPEQVLLQWVLVPDDASKKLADAQLKSGETFINVAQKYSKAPNTSRMGFHFPETSLPKLANFGPDLLPAVKKTPELQQTDWIKFTEGWAKFYVEKKTPARNLTVDDALLKKVRRALAIRKGSQGKDVNARVQDKLKHSKIVIVLESLRDPWQRALDQLQTANPGASSATGNP